MKCEECLQLIDLHFDGELAPVESAAVAEHLTACEACARRHRELSDEQSLYLRHDCDSAESPSFWDEVLSRIEADKTAAPDTFAARLRRRLALTRPTLAAPRFSPLVTAAMLLAAVGLTAVFMSYVRTRETRPGASAVSEHTGGAATPQSDARNDAGRDLAANANPTGEEAGGARERLTTEENHSGAEETRGSRDRERTGTKPSAVKSPSVVKPAVVRLAKGDGRTLAPGAAEPDAERLIQEAERKYLSAIATLSRDVGRRRPQIDSETMASFDRTLAVVDRAIAETRAAARRHPRDPVVVQYMMAAYAKKVDLLRGMAQD